MTPKHTLRFRPALSLLASLLLALHGPTRAVTFTWNSGALPSGGGNWATGANWVGGQVPDSNASTDLNFGASAVTTLTNNIATTPFQVRNIDFAQSAPAYTLGGNSLRFASGGIVNNRNVNVTQTLNLPVSVAGALEFQTQGDIVLNGVLGGTGAGDTLAKTGDGTLTLNAANTFNGAVQVQRGDLVLGRTNALSNAALNLAAGTALSFTNLAGAQVASLAGAGAVNLGSTFLTVAGPAATSFTGVLSGTGGLNKTGSGTLTLRGLNTYTGVTNIFSGQLVLGQANALKNSVVVLSQDNGLNLGGLSTATIGGLAGNRNLNIGTAELTIQAASDSSYGGSLSGSGTLNKNGAANWTLSGANPFNGTVNIHQGQLTLGNAAALSAATVNLAAGSTLTASGVPSVSLGAVSGSGVLALGTANLAWTVGTSGAFDGAITGSGTIEKSGESTLTLSGASPFSGTFHVANGSLSVANADALKYAVLFVSSDIAGDGRVSFASNTGVFRFRALSTQRVALDFGNADIELGFGADASNDYIASYGLTTTGNLTIGGAGTQVIEGPSSMGGTVTVRETARLVLRQDPGAFAYRVEDRGILAVAFRQLGYASVTATADAAVDYRTRIVEGGTLAGSGRHYVPNVTAFNGTTFAAGVTINPADAATLQAVTNQGTVNVKAGDTVNLFYGSNQLGTLNLAGTALTTNWVSVGGRVAINPGGGLVASGGDLNIGSGSIVTLGSATSQGGTLTLAGAGATLQLGSSLLVNNGTLNGKLAINYGSLAKGAGVFNGTVTVNDGGRFSPGNSPGAVTTGDTVWGLGGGYLVELASATGIAGAAWDLWNVNGTLGVAAGSTANSVFTVSLATLDGNDGAAPMAGFDPSRNYSWTVLRTTGGISGFDSQHVVLNTSGFLNATQGGSFNLAQQGNDLVLNFTAAAVPEPGTWAMWAAGLLSLGAVARRRRTP